MACDTCGGSTDHAKHGKTCPACQQIPANARALGVQLPQATLEAIARADEFKRLVAKLGDGNGIVWFGDYQHALITSGMHQKLVNMPKDTTAEARAREFQAKLFETERELQKARKENDRLRAELDEWEDADKEPETATPLQELRARAREKIQAIAEKIDRALDQDS